MVEITRRSVAVTNKFGLALAKTVGEIGSSGRGDN